MNQALADKVPNLRECELLFDMDSDPQKIGLKLLKPGDATKYSRKLNEGSKTSRGLCMNIKGFWVRKLGFDLKETRRFPAHYDETKRLIVVTLESVDRPVGRGVDTVCYNGRKSRTK